MIHIRIKTLFFAAALVLLSPLAQANGLQALEHFLRGTQSGATAFSQTVTSPLRQGEAVARSKSSSGRFEFQRPNRFRFEYSRPFEQLIVADGQTLWQHDIDLNQVVAQRQAEVWAQSPAALIASAADLNALSGAFTLENAPSQGGLDWVLATPRQREGQLQWARIGFRAGQLAALEMSDSFGQLTVLRFEGMGPLPSPANERFRFTPPAGADVIRN